MSVILWPGGCWSLRSISQHSWGRGARWRPARCSTCSPASVHQWGYSGYKDQPSCQRKKHNNKKERKKERKSFTSPKPPWDLIFESFLTLGQIRIWNLLSCHNVVPIFTQHSKHTFDFDFNIFHKTIKSEITLPAVKTTSHLVSKTHSLNSALFHCCSYYWFGLNTHSHCYEYKVILC